MSEIHSESEINSLNKSPNHQSPSKISRPDPQVTESPPQNSWTQSQNSQIKISQKEVKNSVFNSEKEDQKEKPDAIFDNEFWGDVDQESSVREEDKLKTYVNLTGKVRAGKGGDFGRLLKLEGEVKAANCGGERCGNKRRTFNLKSWVLSTRNKKKKIEYKPKHTYEDIRERIKQKNIDKRNEYNRYKDSLLSELKKECTFTPKINNCSKENGSTSEKRDKKLDFYEKNKRWRQEILLRNNKLRQYQEIIDMNYSFEPKLNAKLNSEVLFGIDDSVDYWFRNNNKYITTRLNVLHASKVLQNKSKIKSQSQNSEANTMSNSNTKTFNKIKTINFDNLTPIKTINSGSNTNRNKISCKDKYEYYVLHNELQNMEID